VAIIIHARPGLFHPFTREERKRLEGRREREWGGKKTG
jgi:hypothetical protein